MWKQRLFAYFSFTYLLERDLGSLRIAPSLFPRHRLSLGSHSGRLGNSDSGSKLKSLATSQTTCFRKKEPINDTTTKLKNRNEQNEKKMKQIYVFATKHWKTWQEDCAGNVCIFETILLFQNEVLKTRAFYCLWHAARHGGNLSLQKGLQTSGHVSMTKCSPSNSLLMISFDQNHLLGTLFLWFGKFSSHQ